MDLSKAALPQSCRQSGNMSLAMAALSPAPKSTDLSVRPVLHVETKLIEDQFKFPGQEFREVLSPLLEEQILTENATSFVPRYKESSYYYAACSIWNRTKLKQDVDTNNNLYSRNRGASYQKYAEPYSIKRGWASSKSWVLKNLVLNMNTIKWKILDEYGLRYYQIKSVCKFLIKKCKCFYKWTASVSLKFFFKNKFAKTP